MSYINLTTNWSFWVVKYPQRWGFTWQSPYNKHIHKEQTDIPYPAELYHRITAMSASSANSSALNSNIVRSGSTQNQ